MSDQNEQKKDEVLRLYNVSIAGDVVPVIDAPGLPERWIEAKKKKQQIIQTLVGVLSVEDVQAIVDATRYERTLMKFRLQEQKQVAVPGQKILRPKRITDN